LRVRFSIPWLISQMRLDTCVINCLLYKFMFELNVKQNKKDPTLIDENSEKA